MKHAIDILATKTQRHGRIQTIFGTRSSENAWRRHDKAHLRKRAGISFIEVLLAAALLAAIMIPIMITFGASNAGIQMTSEELVAHNAALELLEQMLAVPFPLLPVGTYGWDQIRDGAVMRGSTIPFRVSAYTEVPLQRLVTITTLEKGGRVRFKKIEVQVTWSPKEAPAAKRTVTLKGLLANENL